MAKVKFKQLRDLDDILTSNKLEDILIGLGQKVLADAQGDPNPEYVASLQMRPFVSKDKKGHLRTNIQIGAAPYIGTAVEAKRGTLARALGAAGA